MAYLSDVKGNPFWRGLTVEWIEGVLGNWVGLPSVQLADAKKEDLYEAVHNLYEVAQLVAPTHVEVVNNPVEAGQKHHSTGVLIEKEAAARRDLLFCNTLWSGGHGGLFNTEILRRDLEVEVSAWRAVEQAVGGRLRGRKSSNVNTLLSLAARDFTDNVKGAMDSGKYHIWFSWCRGEIAPLHPWLACCDIFLSYAEQNGRFLELNESSMLRANIMGLRWKVNPLIRLAQLGVWCMWSLWDKAILCNGPLREIRDDQSRFHAEDGPAILFRGEGGPSRWFWHGTEVPPQVITNPGGMDPQTILSERNIEVRRVMMERYGRDKVFLHLKPTIEHKDKMTGNRLLRLQDNDFNGKLRGLFGDTIVKFVEVTNSTAEPDGTFKKYYLRVPPSVTTAKEGVAWTFRRGEKEYAPAIET